MRGKPTSTELFDATYAVLAAQGRGEALFGDAREAAHLFFSRTRLPGTFPILYLEFPLRDDPYLDLLAIYEQVPVGACFSSGGGYGYQATFVWFGELDTSQKAAIGIELDLSQGVTEQGGIYFQQRKGLGLLREFLATVGQERRADAYQQMSERMPRGWPPSYVGLFPARPGTPMRMGGYLSKPMHRHCQGDPAFLGERFDQMGFKAYDRAMIEQCASLMSLVPAVDFQFDLALDGSLTDTFGLSLSFGRCTLREVDECFSHGYGAQVMELLEGWGLADDRWKLMSSMPFAKGIRYQDDEGHERRLAICVRMNYAKVKFVDGVAQAAKFYLDAAIEELL